MQSSGFMLNVSFVSFIFASNYTIIDPMEELKNIKRPSKEEQSTAIESYNALETVLKEIKDKSPEIEIEETQNKIRIPL